MVQNPAPVPVRVVHVRPHQAKRVKTFLEENKWIHSDYRISPSVRHKGCVAIPVREEFIPLLVQQLQQPLQHEIAVVDVGGLQCCPVSVSCLNRRQGSSITASYSPHAKDLKDSCQNDFQSQFSLTQQALFQTILEQMESDDEPTHESSSSSPSLWSHPLRVASLSESILRLSQTTCPSSFERLGDDGTMVVSKSALRMDDVSLIELLSRCFCGSFNGHCIKAEEEVNEEERGEVRSDAVLDHCSKLVHNNRRRLLFWESFWKHLALIYQSPRIVRRAGVNPNSPVRQSNYHILWPPVTRASNTNIDDDNDNFMFSRKGPELSRGWITVTEQGIRQSFDLTRLMFSRGNVSEKIRFGQRLVKPGERVLDLYAGIGYFTLPALIHGHARHVVACEWNSYAIQALEFNLKDNHVPSHRFTILEGDCRDLAVQHALINQFDRVSLGLLPSSEGGWTTAVRAIRADAGGWLHVHGNVPVREAYQWLEWLCVRILEYVLVLKQQKDYGLNCHDDWLVVGHHLEKVKSFAPKVYHFVADVYVGPRTRYMLHERKNDDPSYSQDEDVFLPKMAKMGWFRCPDSNGELVECRNDVKRPSCALSSTGILHQAWMR